MQKQVNDEHEPIGGPLLEERDWPSYENYASGRSLNRVRGSGRDYSAVLLEGGRWT